MATTLSQNFVAWNVLCNPDYICILEIGMVVVAQECPEVEERMQQQGGCTLRIFQQED